MVETTCARCGRRQDRAANPVEALTWVVEQGPGFRRWLCPQCARTHVRDIEGKLPSDYW
ncbi:hypothetical protein [Gandjariella thermophila]|uniref:Uncharacterized protein n=1 Tax=Gandjariella thermophila TaxID=1931992 RepID=A0A4D4JFV4_9PSEU|nr:hypothetical protein [Gandjariella thermophila]GDY33209.1 hypothetical protein GTS_48420 [Gandjariella thermophila]